MTSSHKRHQKDLRSFFVPSNATKGLTATGTNQSRKKPRHANNGSSFQPCPLCGVSFSLHVLESHASMCQGPVCIKPKPTEKAKQVSTIATPIPGLFLIEDFLTEEEERQILETLDDTTRTDFLPWNPSKFNGTHFGKRWGVHCNLKTKTVTPPEHPLPWFIQDIILSKFQTLRTQLPPRCTNHWIPNEANAIDYRRKQGHYLKGHVDNRQMSKELIANLSLAGDCYMTFQHQKNTSKSIPHKVLLKRRCLQLLTGEARYDYSHGIANSDLLSDRRVSLTMRESPLTNSTTTPTSATITTTTANIKQPMLQGILQTQQRTSSELKS